MKTIASLAILSLLAATPVFAGNEANTNVVAFRASVRVDVDATGKPVKVEAPGDLPEAIRDYIEKRVATWQYEPAKQAGISVAATTYVGVNACAVPVQGGYHLGLDFVGNGLRRAKDQPLPPPYYPNHARHGGTEAAFVLILEVDEEGKATIDRVEKAEIDGRAGRSEFLPELNHWAEKVHFDPESVAGKPVRGRVRVTVSFILPSAHRNLQELREEFQAKTKASRECQVAAGANDMKPIAMDSVVKVTPVPAG